jgi:putative DNA primase/helicase
MRRTAARAAKKAAIVTTDKLNIIRSDKPLPLPPKKSPSAMANGSGATDAPNLSLGEQKPNKLRTTLHFDRIADVEPEAVQWVWPGRIARGKLTLIAGDPGIGKSQITIDITARVTKGEAWPDHGTAGSGSVVMLSAEDSARDTLRPRLEAAGADLERVHSLRAVIVGEKHRTFSLQDDLDALGEKVRAVGDVSLVIIDPITSYMGQIDSHRTTDVRAVLEPLAAFAEQFNVAVLAVTHPPKAPQAKALHAITGSLAFVAAARLVFIAIEEPETGTGRRLLLAVKNNLGAVAAGLGFRLVERIVSKGIVASHIAWDSAPVTTTADQALAAASAGTTAQALGEAVDFLLDELAGGPRAVREIKASAAGAGIASRTLRRAQEKLKIKPHKAGLNEGWQWSLPKEDKPHSDTDGPEDGHPLAEDVQP